MMKILLLLLVCSLMPQVPCKRLKCYFCNDNKGNCGRGAKVTKKVCAKNFGCSTTEEIQEGNVLARYYACTDVKSTLNGECMEMPVELLGVWTNVSICFKLCTTNLCNKVIHYTEAAATTTQLINNITQTVIIGNGSTPTTSAYPAKTSAYTTAATTTAPLYYSTAEPTIQMSRDNMTTTTPSGGRKYKCQLWLVFLSLFAVALMMN